MYWKDNLFVIDSNGLDAVQTHLYGYIIIDSKVIDEEARQNGHQISLTGIGSYDYIERTGDTITISQDFLGSQGIYLYRNEDYLIASQIADDFGFPLNNYQYEKLEDIPFSLEDILGISLYAKGLEHKQMYYKYCFHCARKYRITGAGGEDIRARSNSTLRSLIEQQNHDGRNSISTELCIEAEGANQAIMKAGYTRAQSTLHDSELAEEDITAEAVLDTWHRFHFGKDMLECYMCNEIKFLPLLDPELLKLKLYSKDCSDRNLLMAIIFSRYCPNLLDYPVSGKRHIADETIAKARMVNEAHPFLQSLSFEMIKKDTPKKTEMSKKRADSIVSQITVRDTVRILAASATIQKAFCQVVDRETYESMTIDSSKRIFHPLCQLFAVIAVGMTQLYASTSGSGSNTDFFQLLKEAGISDYITLSMELIKRFEEKEKSLKSDKKLQADKIKKLETENKDQINEIIKQRQELAKIKSSRSYKIGKKLAVIYHKFSEQKKHDRD